MKRNFTLIAHAFEDKRLKSLLMASLLTLGFSGIAQQTYTFTNASATGKFGPTQAQVNTAYAATNLNGAVTVNSVGVQSWTVPQTQGYRITAVGAQGGVSWGSGASMAGDFTLTAGTVLNIVVGQMGGSNNNSHGSGGGGSFVSINNATVPLVVAGGGGGRGASSSNIQSQSHGTIVTAGQTPASGAAPGGVNGGGGAAGASTTGGTQTSPGGNSPSSDWASGGGGFYTAGGNCNTGNTPGGRAFIGTWSVGGDASTTGGITAGGFGGGGGCGDRGAGGGGYSGGGCGTNNSDGGGGGGSFNSGVNQTNASGVNTGHGRVIIESLCFISLTASGNNSLSPAICAGNSVSLTTNATTFTWSTSNTTNSTIVVSPGSTQVYSVIGTSTANCTSANSITVTVNGTAPVLSVSNPSPNVCLGKAVVLGATGAITYSWTGGIQNNVPFMPTTTTVYTVSGQNGCGITTATTAVTVAPIPVSATAAQTLQCQGYSNTLTANAAVTGFTWMPGNLTGSVVVVAPTSNTAYSLAVSDGTCAGTATVFVQTQTTPTISASVSNFTICEGQSTQLSASGAGAGGTYSWTPGGAGAQISVSPTGNTLYQVVGTNSLGCSASAQTAVVVYAAPALVVANSGTVICPNTNIVLTATGGTNYQWVGGPSAASYPVNPSTTTVYTVTANSTTNQCTGSKTVTVNVVQSTAVAPSNTSVCNGSAVVLQASGATSYSWNGVGGTAQFSVSPTTSTIYTLTTKTQSGNAVCNFNYTVQVTVNALPTISVSTTKSLTCKGQSNTLTATGATTYTWSNAANGASVVVNPTITTFYTVNGTDANGCEGVFQVQAKVSTCSGLSEFAETAQLSVFPNPNKGEFTISSATDINLQVVNTIGQVVATVKLDATNNHQVKLSQLSTGVYFITGTDGTSTILQKVVIEK